MSRHLVYFFFFNDTATTEIYTLSLHDALPIYLARRGRDGERAEGRPHHHGRRHPHPPRGGRRGPDHRLLARHQRSPRSEEHTSELQSRQYLVCRLLLEKKKQIKTPQFIPYHST